MIKNFVIIGSLCLFSSNLPAQKALKLNLRPKTSTEVSPIVKEKVEEFAVKINNIIQEEKALMETELKNLPTDNMSKNEQDQMKSAVADRYSEKIDTRIEALGFDLDSVIQKQVRYSLLSVDGNSEEEIRQQLVKKFSSSRNITGYLSYGAMPLTNSSTENALDINKGFSNNFEFGLKFNYQLSRSSPWGITSGVGFSWRTLRLDNNKIFTNLGNEAVNIVNYGGTTAKSKLRTGYVMIPLGVQYNFSKIQNAGMDIQYRTYSGGFRVAGNVYGGVKMASNNIIKGSEGDSRERGDYEVNPFVYGAQVTFSYDGLSIFVKKDFSNYFKNNTFNNDKALIIGVGIGL